jgi:hypothetical protein
MTRVDVAIAEIERLKRIHEENTNKHKMGSISSQEYEKICEKFEDDLSTNQRWKEGIEESELGYLKSKEEQGNLFNLFAPSSNAAPSKPAQNTVSNSNSSNNSPLSFFDSLHAREKEDKRLEAEKKAQILQQEKFAAEKKQKAEMAEKIGKLKNLFKISSSIKIDDVSKMIGMSRDEILNFIIENVDKLSGIKIEGDVIKVSSAAAADGFTELLDNQFFDWGSKESSKFGKIE